jgi:hypothetical protein
MAKGDIETYHEGEVWKNRVEGGQKASNTAQTKAEAQAVGRQMAIDRGVEHVIKKLDGAIGSATPTRGAATRTRRRDKTGQVAAASAGRSWAPIANRQAIAAMESAAFNTFSYWPMAVLDSGVRYSATLTIPALRVRRSLCHSQLASSAI